MDMRNPSLSAAPAVSHNSTSMQRGLLSFKSIEQIQKKKNNTLRNKILMSPISEGGEERELGGESRVKRVM